MVVLRECQLSTAACDCFCLPLPQLGVTTSIGESTVEEGDRSLGYRVDVVLKGQTCPRWVEVDSESRVNGIGGMKHGIVRPEIEMTSQCVATGHICG